jgi:hypothetical protein
MGSKTPYKTRDLGSLREYKEQVQIDLFILILLQYFKPLEWTKT